MVNKHLFKFFLQPDKNNEDPHLIYFVYLVVSDLPIHSGHTT